MYIPRHFKPEEFTMGVENVLYMMDEGFLRKLDQLRDLVRIPLTLNSTYRSPSYNESVGGSPNSKHIGEAESGWKGIAADIACLNSIDRHKIVMEATSLGLTVGIARTFIHVDNRKEGRFPIIFLY